MSNADLIVSGSTHQADRRFSDVSRERQRAFTSLSTLLICANSCRASQWTAGHSRWDTDRRRYHVCPDTETLSLTYLPDWVHWPTMTADRAKPNPLPTASTLCVMCITRGITKFSRSFCQPMNQSLTQPWQYMKIAYDAIKVLELVRNVKIVYFDTESINFINVLLESAKQKVILNSWKAWR